MPPEVMPGALWRPGRLAGYARGATRMQFAVDHCTVGTNSYGIGLNGYFTILFPKVGAPFQFCETNALCWHAAKWNPYGPGAEWERLVEGDPWRRGLSRFEDLTPDQVYWGTRWFEHLRDWGIPPDHYIGPRYDAGGWRGNVNHGDLDSSRTDGITDLRLQEYTAEWQRMRRDGGGDLPELPDEAYINAHRRYAKKMICFWLVWQGLPSGGWVDLYYEGVMLDSFENSGGSPASFGVGPKLKSISDKGIFVQMYTNEPEYRRVQQQVIELAV